MDSGKEELQIEQLKNLKRQLRWWKSGLFCAGVLVVVASVSTVHSSVKGLVEKGPRQDKFVKELTTSFKNDIAPMVEDMARNTVNEVRPQIQASFERVNNRLPELAQASLRELDTLQANLPKRGESVLRQSFGEMLAKKEDDLKAMFPEATEEQIQRLLTNLAESAGEEASIAAIELFGNHHETLERIHVNLEGMAAQEQNLQDVDPTWEMGLLVLDLFREDLESMKPGSESTMMASETVAIQSAKTVASPSKIDAKKAGNKANKPQKVDPKKAAPKAQSKDLEPKKVKK